jgi:putative transposase
MMPQRVHNFGTYFVTTQSWGRRALFRVDELARLLVGTLYEYRSRGSFLLHEFVIMPDHLHLMLTPKGITLERSMQLIKGGYSHAVGETGRTNLEIWQPGFTDHRIRDRADYLHHRDYIYQNPVRAGLCAVPQEYAYSSANPAYEVDPLPAQAFAAKAGGDGEG